MKCKFILGIAFCSFLFFSNSASADSINTIEQKIVKEQEGIQDISDKQESLQEEIQSLEMKIQDLQMQKIEQKSEIINLQLKIDTLDEESQQLKSKMEKRKEILKKRAITLQEESRSTTIFHLLMDSESVSDFLDRIGAAATILEMDSSIIEEMEMEQQGLIDIKKRREARLEQVNIESESLNQIEEELVKEQNKQSLLIKQLEKEKSIKITSKEQLQVLLNEKQEVNTYSNTSFPISEMGSGYNYDVRKVSSVTAEQINSILKGKLNGYGAKYYEVGHNNGIDPGFLAAISMAETGGDSNWLRKYNNIGGFIHNGAMKFATIEDSIEYMGSLLSRLYINDGLVTVEQIHTRYSPVGALNDPTNLNSNWVKNIYAYMGAVGVPL